MSDPWFPSASRAQTYPWGNRPTIRPNVLVLHTTEGNGWPAYNNSYPHITYRAATREFRQHIPADRAAMALVDAPGGVATNRLNAFQLEIADCTSGWASAENPRRPYTIGRKSADLSDDNLADIGGLLAWLHREWDVPLTMTGRGFVSWRTSSRMSADEWNNFRGVCGHQHVPENDHTDPGLINAARIIDHAARAAAPTLPTAPAQPEADRLWWGNRPHPQEPQFLNVAHLRAAMEHDGPHPSRELFWYADQVWAVQRMLESIGWLRPGAYVPGHYGTYTRGDAGNMDDGGVAGFQVKRGGVGDGWLGPRELETLQDMATNPRPRYRVIA